MKLQPQKAATHKSATAQLYRLALIKLIPGAWESWAGKVKIS